MTSPAILGGNILNGNILNELSKTEFYQVLLSNPGVVILKFGAEWCGPCKLIEAQVKELMEKMPADKTVNAIIDVDESIDLYMFLKNKKMVKGIPTILCYKHGNTDFAPDDCVIGADSIEVNAFFSRCLSYIS
jgi:thioredoxin 1